MNMFVNYYTVAAVNNPLVNFANWLTSGFQALGLVAIIVIGVFLLIKKQMMKLLTFGIIAAIASVFIFNPAAFQNIGNFLIHDVLGL